MTLAVVWGDVATWLAAAGTVGAVVVSLWLAGKEGRERKRDERRRQAESITGWISGPYALEENRNDRFLAPVALQNGSSQLAYRVVVSLIKDPRGLGESSPSPDHRWRAFIGELPPGRTDLEIEHPGGGMSFRAALELAFQDAAGRRWVRKSNGQLKEIATDPASYYDLTEPLPWSYPLRAETP